LLTRQATVDTSSHFASRPTAGILARAWAGLKSAGRFVSWAYFAVVGFLAAPFSWLLRRVAPLDDRMAARTSGARVIFRPFLWLLRLPVSATRGLLDWIAFLIVYGPLWAIGLLVVVYSIILAEWVGGIWLGGLASWLVLRGHMKWYLRAAARIGGMVALGVTPQFLFLLLYNGLADLGIALPAALDAVIKLYEYGAVRLNELLQPIGEVPWYWWVGAAVTLLFVAAIFEAPSIVNRALRLRQAMAALVFMASITGSIGFSALNVIKDWQPDVQARLYAKLKEQSFYESTITVSQELTRWFQTNRSRVTALPVYVRTFEEAIRDAAAGSKEVKPEDVHRGTQTAARGLVPADAANIAVSEAGLVHSGAARVPGQADELLAYDAELRRSNLEIKARAAQIRATAVNTIAQIVDVHVASQPLLREILGEMINATAERISQRIFDRLPIERGMTMVRNSSDAAHRSVSVNADKLAEALFSGHEPMRAEGVYLALKAAVAHEIGKASSERVQAEARARSRARVRR
jgi:hypothetical protein